MSASEDFLDYKLNVVTTPNTKISFKSVAESDIIKGNISGDIINTSYKEFNETSVECELLGDLTREEVLVVDLQLLKI